MYKLAEASTGHRKRGWVPPPQLLAPAALGGNSSRCLSLGCSATGAGGAGVRHPMAMGSIRGLQGGMVPMPIQLRWAVLARA